MSTEMQIILWGVAACMPLFLNMVTRRNADAVGLAAVLLATWAFGRITAILFTTPENMTLYPIEDAICGALSFVAWRTQREWWKLGLSILFVLQCALHAAFWAAWETGRHEALLFYVTSNNGLFALELLVVGWGAVDVLAHRLGGRLPRVARQFHLGWLFP